MLIRVWKERQHIFRALAYGIVNDRNLVEDILQESVTRILKSKRSFKSSEEAFNYLRCTVVTTAIDWYRRLSRYRGHFSPRPIDSPCRKTAHSSPGPLDLLLRNEETELRRGLVDDVKSAIRRLPLEQREAIDIFFSRQNGEKIKTLCREKGVPYSTMRSRMIRGIDRIRAHFKDREINGFGREPRGGDR